MDPYEEIKSLLARGIDQSKIDRDFAGTIEKVVERYFYKKSSNASTFEYQALGDNPVEFKETKIPAKIGLRAHLWACKSAQQNGTYRWQVELVSGEALYFDIDEQMPGRIQVYAYKGEAGYDNLKDLVRRVEAAL